MTEGQDVLAAAEPTFDEWPQNSFTAWRAESAAMDDAHTALAGVDRLRQKARNFLVCFVPVEAVQVGMIADRPATTPPVSYTHLDVYKRQN